MSPAVSARQVALMMALQIAHVVSVDAERIEVMDDVRRALEIADTERERIGRELHDGLCQTLAGIAALSSTLASKLVANSQPEASAAAAEITQLLIGAISEARDLEHG